jgi:hypothetical protein
MPVPPYRAPGRLGGLRIFTFTLSNNYDALTRLVLTGGGSRLTRCAIIESWKADGIGRRAVLTSAELVTLLGTVL